MNDICVIICNYNKADYVVKCVRKVKRQTMKQFDICVVDNASTDSSVRNLCDTFGSTVSIVVNSENTGGSGGFDTGIKRAQQLGYRYVMLMDNDAMLEEHALEYLYTYMEKHQNVGLCGAATLNMHHPEVYQDFGGRLDSDTYYMKGIMAWERELPLPVAMECDYVASCALLCRMDAVAAAGGMPVTNFIYWDDVELCARCRAAGYKVMVLGRAKAYHDISGGGPHNLFLAYYANRNRYRFYTKFLPQEQVEAFYSFVTRELFLKLYGCPPKGMTATMWTAWSAWDDFAHGRTGKAGDKTIGIFTEGSNGLREGLLKWERILIHMPLHNAEYYQILHALLHYFSTVNDCIEVTVTLSPEEYDLADFDALLRLCKHVTQVQENILPWCYIDAHKNWISSEQEYLYFSSFETALERFRRMYRPYFDARRKELEEDGRG